MYGATGAADFIDLVLLQLVARYLHDWHNNPVNSTDIMSGYDAVVEGGTLGVVDYTPSGQRRLALNMRRKLTPKIMLARLTQSALFFLIYACNACSVQMALPSDATLLREFNSHRGEFERLRQMATEDMHQQGSFTLATISDVLAESRRDKYRNLLNISPNLLVGIDYDGTTRFIFGKSDGLAIGPGWAKGIQFVPDGARLKETRTDSLDESGKLAAGVYLRKIEPQWFIFYQRDE
jgi:hypothetical protein